MGDLFVLLCVFAQELTRSPPSQSVLGLYRTMLQLVLAHQASGMPGFVASASTPTLNSANNSNSRNSSASVSAAAANASAASLHEEFAALERIVLGRHRQQQLLRQQLRATLANV